MAALVAVDPDPSKPTAKGVGPAAIELLTIARGGVAVLGGVVVLLTVIVVVA